MKIKIINPHRFIGKVLIDISRDSSVSTSIEDGLMELGHTFSKIPNFNGDLECNKWMLLEASTCS